jgi:endo-1,4-beta-mannosidase
MAATGAPNAYVLNLYELQNVVTNAGGVGTNTLSTAVAQIQQMVLFDTKQIKANILGTFDTSTIQVIDPFTTSTTVIGGQLIISAAGTPGIGKYLTCVDTLGTAEWLPFSAPSDREWKKDIRPLEDAGTILQGIHGVRFCWKETGVSDVGVIAQDIAIALPEAYIERTATRPAMVEYTKIIPVLVETVKDLQRRVAELEGIIYLDNSSTD